MRRIEITWFNTLTRILSSYMEVLRYEMRQGAGEQTVEALIHAEMFKILVREFPSDCVRSEFPIGHHFAPKKAKDKDDEEVITPRQFRADIAIFNPLTEPPFGEGAAKQPLAVFELKRTGTKKELHDDIYRLGVVSKNTGAVGYFVLAAPTSHLVKMLAHLELLKGLLKIEDDPITIQFGEFSKVCQIYDVADHKQGENFHVKLMYGTVEVLDLLEKMQAPLTGNASPASGTSTSGHTAVANPLEEEGYGFAIYGISVNEAVLKLPAHHRINLELRPYSPQRAIKLDLGQQ